MAGITGSLCERGSEVQRMSRASPDVRLCCPLVVTGSIKYDRLKDAGGGGGDLRRLRRCKHFVPRPLSFYCLFPPPPHKPFFGFRSLLIRSGKTPKPFTFMCAQSRDPELRLKLQAPCLLEILGVTPEMNAIVIHLYKIGE